MNIFDVLIIGGGPAGLSCALTLGSAGKKPFVTDKKIGIFIHQSESGMHTALFNNALGINPGTKGGDILIHGQKHLSDLYPQIQQISDEKVLKIDGKEGNFTVIAEQNTYTAKQIVVAVTPSSHFNIEGLLSYVAAHPKMPEAKKRIHLRNIDHVVAPGIFVAGVLAGHRSQFIIAAGSGAAVATDILSAWNEGNHTMVHDVLPADK